MIAMAEDKEKRFIVTYESSNKYYDLEQWVKLFGGWIGQQWTATRIKDGETFAGNVVMMHQTCIVLTFLGDYKAINFREWYLRRIR